MRSLATTLIAGAVCLFMIGATASAGILDVDFNRDASPTQSGFESFVTDGSGVPNSQVILGHTITIAPLGGASLQARDRHDPGTGKNFELSSVGDLYRDFIQAAGGTGDPGLNLSISNLTPATDYDLTFWTKEVFNPGDDLITVRDGHTNAFLTDQFNTESPIVPTDLSAMRFDITTATNAAGVLSIDMTHTREDLVGLSLNAFQLVPEPATLSLLGIGGLLIGRRRRS